MKQPTVSLKSHAFVAAESSSIRARPLRVRLFDRPIVLFRTRAGHVAALEDRCAHRGVPLSAGAVEGEFIRCAYHGWSFSADGYCVEIPGTAAGGPLCAVRVPSLKVWERDGFVWVSECDNALLPQRVIALNPGNCRFRWHTTWAAGVVSIQENFLDALHTHFIHPGLVRRSDRRQPVQAALCVEDDGFKVDYLGQPEQSGWLFRLFESPRTRERAYFSRCAVAQLEFMYAKGWTAWITLYCTPETARTTHVFASLHLEGRRIPSWAIRALLWPFVSRIAKQDRAIVEMQERASTEFPSRITVSTDMDIARPYIQAAWDDSIGRLPPNRFVALQL